MHGQNNWKNNVKIPDFLSSVVSDFCEFAKSNKIDEVTYRNEFRFASENERRAVIVMCDVTGLNKFFDEINKKYHMKLEYPPTHVTLYTLQLNAGIFLTDSKDIEKLSMSIENPGLILQ